MSAPEFTVPAEWKAPSEDGEFLIWPNPSELIAQTRANQRALQSCETLVQNAPLRELRSAQRKWVGHSEDARPLVATGHQVELFHPGVWAKDVLINELAAKLDGAAWHFAVDTDAPKHLHLRWPGGSGPITDDAELSTAHWVGLLQAPSPVHVEALRADFDRAASQWGFAPLLDTFLSSLKLLSIESPSLALNLVNAIHESDWNLGLRHHALPASPIWQSPGYLAFSHHILAHADQFASIYNSTLADYRREMSMRNSGRPWPDLQTSPDACEVPFWCDDLAARKRSRSQLRRIGGRWAFGCGGGEPFLLDPSADAADAAQRLGRFLAAHSMRLSPRAMTLTMFLRLMVVDQFVHGIGGGRYDRITDRVIHRFLKMSPPEFSVTTATLLFPAAASQRLADLNALRVEGRRLYHLWADAGKRQTVRQIAQLPRKSKERRRLFHEMHEKLTAAAAHPPYTDWQQRFAEVQHMQAEQSTLFDRELFFLVQSEERLRSLIAKYHEQFSTL